MDLNAIRAAGAARLGELDLSGGPEHFYAALLAYAARDAAAATRHARAAAQATPESLVYRHAAAYLERTGGAAASVYDSAAAFRAFIRDGGNIPLYVATSQALREIYADYSALRLLDVGVGDGMALLPALGPNVAALDLVEPSVALLEQTVAALEGRQPPARAFRGTLQEFARVIRPRERWDIAQATFSIQSIPPHERAVGLRWLRGAAERLLVVEFDAPAACADALAPACVADVAARYERGLAEYERQGDLVAQGFLMPVLLGYFDPTAARTNYEQPIGAWEADLREAGFTSVRATPLYDYWWATAYLIDAS